MMWTPPAQPASIPNACDSWPLSGGCVRSLAAGPEMICAVTSTRAFCWGPGATAREPQHRDILVLTPAEAQAFKPDGACAPSNDGATLAACRSAGAQVALRLPVAPELGLKSADQVQKFAVGLEHACALVNANVFCTGATWWSVRGERNPNRYFDDPNRVAIEGVSDLVVRERTTCALARGDVYCWGDGRYFPPGAMRAPATKFVASAFPMGDFGCFLGADGSLWCGVNGDYQPITAIPDVKQIVGIVPDEVCARSGDGVVRCVGRNGEPRARPFLTPAKQLVNGVPCAQLENGRVHCDAWRFESQDFGATSLDGLGVTRGIGATDVGGRPGVCAVSERGDVQCWGVTGFDWSREKVGRWGDQWLLHDHYQAQPVLLPGPKDVIEISRRGGCLRTRNGEIWLVAASAQRPNLKQVRLAARTVKGADRAVSIADHGCVARRNDGSEFVLTPDWPFNAEPVAVAPPRLEASNRSSGQDELGGTPESHVVVGKHYGVECALRVDAGISCRDIDVGKKKLTGPVFNPLLRSTLPMRVIPAQ